MSTIAWTSERSSTVHGFGNPTVVVRLTLGIRQAVWGVRVV